MILTTYVVLTLTVWDTDTGTKLYEAERPMWKQEFGEDLIERCRLTGLNEARELVTWYRYDKDGVKYSNAFVNVNCEWHRGTPA